MKKLSIFIIIIFVIVIIFGLLFNILGISRAINNSINNFINKEPIISCISDSDCEYKPTSCDTCRGYMHVNKKYNSFCIIPILEFVSCDGYLPRQAKCYKNKCIAAIFYEKLINGELNETNN